MLFQDKLLAALDASRTSPEDFGERLAIATAPINLDDCKSRAQRASMRAWFLQLPYGYDIISHDLASMVFVLENMNGVVSREVDFSAVCSMIPTSAHLFNEIESLAIGEHVKLVPGGRCYRVK